MITLTEDQELLLESLDEFLDTCEFDESYVEDCWNNNKICEEFNKALIDAGFGLLGIPEEYGGTPCDLVTQILIAERLAVRGYPTDIIGNALQIDDIVAFGSEEQKKMVFDHLTTKGTMAFSLGISEPQAGSDNNSMTASARHEGGNVILNGHKTFTTNGLELPYILFLAREADMEGNPISMYLVPSDAPGVTLKPMHKIGCRTGSLCETYVENVVLPDSALVGEAGKGFFQLMKNFEIERLVIAAMALGMAQCAFDEAAAYANQRVQFGKPIGKQQLIQEKITRCYTKLQNMRNLVYSTAQKKDAGESIRIDSGITKLYCAQEGFNVIDDCMQIMGGIGYTEDCRISRLWRDIRMHRIGGGTDEIMVYTTSREILKQYQ